MTLRDWLPREATSGEFAGARFLRHLDEDVVAIHDGCEVAWPGRHRNVLNWVELRNGIAVGFNENPSVGWSFPVKRIRKPRR